MLRWSLLPVMVLLVGCYTLRPAGSTVREGTRMAFDLNDAGRVAMAERIGPEILQLEGRVLSTENGDYTLAVRTVRYVRGGEQVWAGERVQIAKEHVGSTWERRFNPARTAVLAGITVAAVAAFFVTREFLLGGDEPTDNRPDPDGNAFIWPPARVTP